MNYVEFINDINKEVLPIYIFYGNEKYLQDEAIKKLKNKLLNKNTEEMNYTIINDANDENIIDAFETLPFMSEHRLTIVRDDDILRKLSDNIIDKIIDRLQENNNKSCVVLIFDEKIDLRKKFFKAVNKIGDIVNFESIKYTEAINYVGYFVRRHGKSIKRQVAEYIVRNCGADLNTILNEVNKLVAYSDKNVISLNDANAIVSNNINESIFKMVKYIGTKNESMAIYSLNKIILSGENSIVILSMIIRQFRMILKAKYYLKKTNNTNDLLKLLKIPNFALKDIIEQCNYFSDIDILNAYNACVKCDKDLKSGHDGKIILESLLRKLCN